MSVKLTREEIKAKVAASTVKELRKKAAEYNVVGRWEMNKQQLVEVICDLLEEEEKRKPVAKCKIVDDAKGENGSDADSFQNAPRKTKDEYIRKISIGTIVAFRVIVRGIEKVKSAAVIEINEDKKFYRVMNKAGFEFVIDESELVWVKTGKRWPRGVYNLLKANEFEFAKER